MYKSVPAVTFWQITTLNPGLGEMIWKWTLKDKESSVKWNVKGLDLQLLMPIQMENKAADFVPTMMNYEVGLFLMSKLQEG